jgi:hypothetical protein
VSSPHSSCSSCLPLSLQVDLAETGQGDGAGEAEVAAADTERLDGADHLQRFGIAPEHQTNF